jgi:hypothetical protein
MENKKQTLELKRVETHLREQVVSMAAMNLSVHKVYNSES